MGNTKSYALYAIKILGSCQQKKKEKDSKHVSVQITAKAYECICRSHHNDPAARVIQFHEANNSKYVCSS